MSIDLSRFYESFFSESLEGLDAAESGLLELEENEPTAEGLNAIFRGIHSIKGTAGSLGLSAISDFTHHVEGTLDRLRQGSLAPSRDALDVLLHCVDYSRKLLLATRDGQAIDAAQAENLIAELQRFTETASAEAEFTQTEVDTPPAQHDFHIRFEPSRSFFENGNDPMRLLRVLDGLGEMNVIADLSNLPLEQFNPEHCYLAWDINIRSAAQQNEIEEVFSWVIDDCKLTVKAFDRSEPVPPELQPSQSDRRRDDRRKSDRRSSSRRAEDTDVTTEVRADRLHVSRDKVDGLINLVGELVITKTMLKETIS